MHANAFLSVFSCAGLNYIRQILPYKHTKTTSIHRSYCSSRLVIGRKKKNTTKCLNSHWSVQTTWISVINCRTRWRRFHGWHLVTVGALNYSSMLEIICKWASSVRLLVLNITQAHSCLTGKTTKENERLSAHCSVISGVTFPEIHSSDILAFSAGDYKAKRVSAAGTYVHPHFFYLSCVWCVTGRSHEDKAALYSFQEGAKVKHKWGGH